MEAQELRKGRIRALQQYGFRQAMIVNISRMRKHFCSVIASFSERLEWKPGGGVKMWEKEQTQGPRETELNQRNTRNSISFVPYVHGVAPPSATSITSDYRTSVCGINVVLLTPKGLKAFINWVIVPLAISGVNQEAKTLVSLITHYSRADRSRQEHEKTSSSWTFFGYLRS